MSGIFTLSKPENFCNKRHYHKQVEMLYILEGQLEVYVEQDMFTLRDGDIVLIGSSELHRDRAFSVKYIVFQFDCQQYLDPTTLPYLKFFMNANTQQAELYSLGPRRCQTYDPKRYSNDISGSESKETGVRTGDQHVDPANFADLYALRQQTGAARTRTQVYASVTTRA
ncbi:cupin domain-containing protein [Paenibacillus allorhizosphaerae]|uniref:cupin domain-containing protein n=1 Tax=Paenibacillus allorhizosphaerae TaxID=2849866 RepID=UPI001C4060E4|nr:cupin domain-containing protein [Paenibacillus allorhizosphaerae]